MVSGFARDLFILDMPGRGGSGGTDTTSGGVGGAIGGSFSGSRVASVFLDVSGLEPFDPKGEAYNLSQRWKRWKRALYLYVNGKRRFERRSKVSSSVACCRYGRSRNLFHNSR